jgi:hypothetical protein
MDNNGNKQSKRARKRLKGLSLFKVQIGGHEYWRVVVPQVGGQRWTKTFKDKRQAEAFYECEHDLLKNSGRRSFALADRQRQDAQAAIEQLSPFSGVSLLDAARFYVAAHEAVNRSCTVAEAIKALLATKEADGRRHRYILDLRTRLKRFAEDFGERILASITGPEIGAWLRSLAAAPRTRNTYHLRVHLLFAFALEQRWVNANPCTASMRAKAIESEPGILTPEQFARLLSNASPDMLPYWAIGGFAGLRRAELERLEWSDIDFDAGLIEVDPG